MMGGLSEDSIRIARKLTFSKACISYYTLTILDLSYLIGLSSPYLMNGFSHHSRMGESTFSFRDVRSDF